MTQSHASRSSARIGTAPWAILACLLAACTLGDGDELDSAYETAILDVASTSGVADGQTPLTITVSGLPNAELTLEVIGDGATFVAGNQGTPQEKTVYLQDLTGDGTGVATASVVSNQEGVVTIDLKADRVRTLRELTFEPVRMAVGPAVPVRLQPGLVMHEVCVAVNSAYGTLRPDVLEIPGFETGTFAPMAREVRPELPAGAMCPTEPVDSFGWQGYALFTWGTPADFAQLVMSYLGPDETPLASDILDLDGSAFGGYDVVATPPQNSDSWTSIAVSLAYPTTGPLPGGPAAGVTLQSRFIPDGGPTFLGSSSGGPEEAPMTDLDGDVVLFFDTAGLVGTFALFVTPENGATVYLTDIELP